MPVGLRDGTSASHLAEPHLGGPEVEFVTTTHTGSDFNIRPTQVGLNWACAGLSPLKPAGMRDAGGVSFFLQQSKK